MTNEYDDWRLRCEYNLNAMSYVNPSASPTISILIMLSYRNISYTNCFVFHRLCRIHVGHGERLKLSEVGSFPNIKLFNTAPALLSACMQFSKLTPWLLLERIDFIFRNIKCLLPITINDKRHIEWSWLSIIDVVIKIFTKHNKGT